MYVIRKRHYLSPSDPQLVKNPVYFVLAGPYGVLRHCQYDTTRTCSSLCAKFMFSKGTTTENSLSVTLFCSTKQTMFGLEIVDDGEKNF